MDPCVPIRIPNSQQWKKTPNTCCGQNKSTTFDGNFEAPAIEDASVKPAESYQSELLGHTIFTCLVSWVEWDLYIPPLGDFILRLKNGVG